MFKIFLIVNGSKANLIPQGIVEEVKIIKKPNGNFFLLPNKIFAEKMKPREFIVYSYLKCCSDNKQHKCFPSLKTIAKNCNISTVTASAAIKSLEENGYIDITHRYGEDNYLSNLYTVLKI